MRTRHILHRRDAGKGVLCVKNFSVLVGAGVLCIGFGILVASFLPPVILVCIEALLLILAGLLALKC